MNGGRAVSRNGRRIDAHIIEINVLQESFHLFSTPATRCFSITGRIEIAASRCHHHWAEVSHVKHENARANPFCEPNRKL
jgi:hypothetical protein